MDGCTGGCACDLMVEDVERAFRSGASFDHCFDRLADALRCSGNGDCRKRTNVSERAASLVFKLLRRG